MQFLPDTCCLRVNVCTGGTFISFKTDGSPSSVAKSLQAYFTQAAGTCWKINY